MKGLRDFAKLNLITAFGTTVLANIAVAGFIGWLIDKYTFNNRVIFVISLFFGTISGIYNGVRELLKEAEKYEKFDKKDDNDNSGSHSS